jgi:predicted transcriptional regulator
MLEQFIPAVIALVSGGAILFQRVHNRIAEIDKRVDQVELRVVESYVSKSDFQLAIEKMEGHMERIESKLDKIVINCK